MACNVKQQFEDYKTKLSQEAEDLIYKIFPEKVLELDAVLETDTFCLEDVTTVLDIQEATSDDQLAKKRKLENGKGEGGDKNGVQHKTIPCNKYICEAICVVKPHIQKLTDYCNLLEMWITFLVPKIEDGDNFGVEIQQGTQSAVSSVSEDLQNFSSKISDYFNNRGKLVERLVKYPFVNDFREALSVMDEQMYATLKLVVCEIRNNYSSLHDVITKNIEKIKCPKNRNGETLMM